MKRTNKVAWVLVGVLAVVFAYAGGLFLFGQRISKREALHLIKSQLPLGSDKMEVQRFLEARGWQHWGVDTTDEFERSFDPGSIRYGAAQVIRARIDNIGPGWSGGFGFLQIGFAFNRQGKLTRYLVEQVGPALP